MNMSTSEWIISIIVFVFAGVLLFSGIRSFLGRGFLLNNAYIYASEADRKKMNKKPYYKQSAVVFCILSAVFFVIGLAVVLKSDKLFLLEIPLIAAAVVYAVVSTAKIGNQSKK